MRPYPQFTRVNFGQPTADNTLQALLVKVEKRMTNRHQYLVSHTLSNADDTNFSNRYGDRYGFVADNAAGRSPIGVIGWWRAASCRGPYEHAVVA